MSLSSHESLLKIRQFELGRILPLIKTNANILEIGAGAGWQSLALAKAGHNVTAVDIATNKFQCETVFLVRVFDGKSLPFSNNQFDTIFSSNVIEHVGDFDIFSLELKRVLCSAGVSIHIVPSASWRFWTSLTHPIYLVKLLFQSFSTSKDAGHRLHLLSKLAEEKKEGKLKMLKLIYPRRHGERGSSISELFTFSRWGWDFFFEKNGWYVSSRLPCGIFYTGNQIAEKKLSIAVRCKLAKWFGSSTWVYILDRGL